MFKVRGNPTWRTGVIRYSGRDGTGRDGRGPLQRCVRGYMGWFSFIRFDLLFVCLLLGFIYFCFCLFVFLYLQFLFVLNSRVIFFHVLLFVFD